MYSDRFSLPFIARVLITAAERRRPGLGPWTPEVREELLAIFRAELVEIRARFLELMDDRPYFDRVEKILLEDGFTRYAALAEKQTGLEQRDYGIWRGGDVFSRVVLGGVGLTVGALIARAPFIPLPTSADIVVMLAALGTPLLPDLQVRWHQRRYRKGLDRIVKDMEAAFEQQRLYEPLPGAVAEPLPDVTPISQAPLDPTSEASSGSKNRERG